jgi:DNA (cytosine-5)-methyltransferase 1
MSKKGRAPTCVDLFAGAGGLAEGFRQAGWRILAGADLDTFAASTFRANFPDAKFFIGPVSKLKPKQFMKALGLRPGQLDCLIGGPPCQSFSYNNHSRSASDRRARLFRDYLRIVRALRPKCLVMENVPGLLTIGEGVVIEEIKRRLGRLGYILSVRILYSEDFGVPQKRRRVFIVGTRLLRNEWAFPAGTHGPAPKPSEEANTLVHRWSPRGRGRKAKPFVTVWQAIGDLPRLHNGGGAEELRYTRKAHNVFQRRARRDASQLLNHRVHRVSPKMITRMRSIPEGGNWLNIPRRLLPAGMKRAKKCDHTRRYGRLSRKDLCCTILTKCDPHWGSYIHPLDDRTISVREAARLQSFPDHFRFMGPISRQYEQVGNAVPPAMAAPIAQSLHTLVNDRK